MNTIELNKSEFDQITTNETGIVAQIGLVIKKISGNDWYRLEYKSVRKKDFPIGIKQTIQEKKIIQMVKENPDYRENDDIKKSRFILEDIEIIENKDIYIEFKEERDDWEIEIKKIIIK